MGIVLFFISYRKLHSILCDYPFETVRSSFICISSFVIIRSRQLSLVLSVFHPL